jgi:hypothetical protein
MVWRGLAFTSISSMSFRTTSQVGRCPGGNLVASGPSRQANPSLPCCRTPSIARAPSVPSRSGMTRRASATESYIRVDRHRRRFRCATQPRNLVETTETPGETTAAPVTACWRPHSGRSCWRRSSGTDDQFIADCDDGSVLNDVNCQFIRCRRCSVDAGIAARSFCGISAASVGAGNSVDQTCAPIEAFVLHKVDVYRRQRCFHGASTMPRLRLLANTCDLVQLRDLRFLVRKLKALHP